MDRMEIAAAPPPSRLLEQEMQPVAVA